MLYRDAGREFQRSRRIGVESEREQVEALRKWWKENGKTTIVGIVLGLGSVFGWTSWQTHQQVQMELASQRYQSLVETAAQNAHQEVSQQAASLLADFPGSGYAALASLVAAHSALTRKELAQVKEQLSWVVNNASNEQIKDLARLRLARLALNESDYASALAYLDAIKGSSYANLAAEVRGDAQVAQGQVPAARETYQSVIASDDLSSDTRSRVQAKLNDLGTYNIPNGDA